MKWLREKVLYPIRSRLFYKMLIIYSMLTLIPLIILSTTFYVRSSQLIEKEATEEAQKKLSYSAEKFDELLYAVQSRMIPLGDNELIQSWIQQDYAQGLTDSLQSELSISKQRIGDVIDNIYLIDKAGKVYSADVDKPLKYPKAYWEMPFEFTRMPEWAFFPDNKRMVCVITIYKIGQRSTPESEVGRLVFALNTDKVKAMYNSFDPGTFFIASSDNLDMSSSDSAQIGKLLDFRETDNQLVIRQKSRYSEFQYILLAKSGTGQFVKKQAVFSIAVTLVAWLMIIFVTYTILRRITKPIQRLTILMRKAEKEDYQLIEETSSRDEVAVLCTGYNRLVMRTSDLIEKNYKNELLIREAELKAIRMYITPHFLYNTLECISIMSGSAEKARHIPRMIHNLSGIFRFSIMSGNVFVPLETEMEFIRKYIEIHSFRYGNRLSHSIDFPDMYRHISVPKLILQPLVENSILHGIDQIPEGGSIHIRVKDEQFRLVIEIENSVLPVSGDTGNRAISGKRQQGLGSGLENVNARIHHHYGNDYGVRLIRNDFTVIARVDVPMQIWEEEEKPCVL